MGGLGNQMFQYAFSLSLSKKYKTFFILANASQSQFFKYFNISHFTRIQFLNKLLLIYYRVFINKKIHQIGDEPIFEFKKKCTNNLYYIGYFQSEIYFDNIKNEIKNKFDIKRKYKDIFLNKYSYLFKQRILAIHCRFGDYLCLDNDNLGGRDLSLPTTYYRNALNQIDNLSDYQIVIVSDDKIMCTSRFGFIENKLIISEHEIIDFQILLNAHKLIISNSTFSWWAAYLNNKEAKVYAPEYWLGHKIKQEWPVGIMHNSFEKISF